MAKSLISSCFFFVLRRVSQRQVDSLRHIIGKVKTNTRLRSHLQGKVSHTLSETLSFSFQSI